MPVPLTPDISIPAGVARYLVLAGIRGYQALLSPFFGGSCRFLPSCSEYAVGAVERHGVIKGGFLTVRRLAKCHPFCTGGRDPVPID